MSMVLEPLVDDPEFRGNLALGDEQKKFVDWQCEIAIDHLRPVSRQSNNPRLRFYVLADQWREETRYLSSISQVSTHPCYQQIIGMGSIVIPLILKELEERPAYWFWALKAISGVDPVPFQFKGKIDRMTQYWLSWGREHDYVE